MVCALLYVGNGQEMALGFKTAIFLIYGVFLFRLYWRLAKAFGKGKLFAFALIFIPAIFLIVLGKGKAQFTQPEFKPDKERTKTNLIVRRIIFVVISAIEVVVIVSGIAFVCILTVTPPVIVNYLLDDNYASTKDVTGTGELVAREDIVLLVEWNPVKGDEEPETGHIVGYTMADDDNIIDTKGSLTLEAGDSIQFLFDYYDAEGNLIATQPQGDVIRVSKQERINIEYKPIESGIIDFGGVLTDVYQRVMTTEMIEGEV